MKLSDVARKVIDLATKVRDYHSVALPKRHPNYPIIGLDEPETRPPAEEKELRAFFKPLNPELIFPLLLIMHLGRRDFAVGLCSSFWPRFVNKRTEAKTMSTAAVLSINEDGKLSYTPDCRHGGFWAWLAIQPATTQ